MSIELVVSLIKAVMLPLRASMLRPPDRPRHQGGLTRHQGGVTRNQGGVTRHQGGINRPFFSCATS